MTDTVICFHQCEVDIAAREVRLNGLPSWIEPRPFDLLVHLIRHRERVVAKKELLAKVWPHEFVSTGALARAVMKARRAIGDLGEPALIRTVPRVGYRFVAPVSSSVPDLVAPVFAASNSALVDQPAPLDARKLTIALLPFEDATNDPRFDWIRLGLMSLVREMLLQDTRLSSASTQSVMTVATSEPHTDAQSLAAMVQRLTNVQLAVGGKVSFGKGEYRFDYRVFSGSRELQGVVTAEHPTALAEPLVRALKQSLLGHSQHDGAATFVSSLATEALARGLQASAEEKWSQAANLFKMVLELAPRNAAVELELLRALANKGDTGGKRLARRLLARAENESDLFLAARVHQVMGCLHLHCGALGPAAFRAEKALRIAAGQESLDWTAQTLLLQASIHMRRRDFDAANRSIQRVHELCERRGNLIFPLGALNMQAVIAGLQGDLPKAVDVFTEVANRSRQFGAQRYLADACVNAAKGLALLGQFVAAAGYGEESFALAVSNGDWVDAARTASTLCLIYRLARAPQPCERSMTALANLPDMPDASEDVLWQARGHHAACAGDHETAAQCFSNAIALQRRSNDSVRERDTWPWLITALVQCGRVDDADAELGLASSSEHMDDQEFSVRMRHCHALIAHANGAAVHALRILDEIVHMEAAPLWSACACIDAAWLLAEAGRGDEATALLGGSEAASRPHPLTLAATARALHAAGDFEGAYRSHLGHMSMVPAPVEGDYFASLGPIYAGANAATVVPSIPFLPSRM